MPDALQCIESLVKISNKFDHISVGILCWIGNQGLDFAETLHSFLLSGQETDVSIFSSSNFPVRWNQPKKFKISTFLLVWRKFTIIC